MNGKPPRIRQRENHRREAIPLTDADYGYIVLICTELNYYID